MKKTKVVIPALGIIAFATAASITGTVAWFTASRSFTMTAGDFAVVSTKNNLVATLAEGIGTDYTSGTQMDVAGSNRLTDASFNHKNHDFIEPDEDGHYMDDVYTLEDGLDTDFRRAGLVEAGVYSAFTWDITFKLNVSANNYRVGLFLDFSNDNSWAQRKGAINFALGHKITANEVGTYYTNAELTANPTPFALNHEIDSTEASTPYYRADPIDTGKGIRVAFVPKVIPATSIGYTKVWAPQQTSGNVKYIDETTIPEFSAASAYDAGTVVKKDGQFYKAKVAKAAEAVWTAANWEQNALLSAYATSYANITSSLAGNVFANNVNTTNNVVLMAKGDTIETPDELDIDSDDALSDYSNYLGYFQNPGNGNPVELTYTCVVWYEGTDPEIVNELDTVYETMHLSMEFTTVALTDVAS